MKGRLLVLGGVSALFAISLMTAIVIVLFNGTKSMDSQHDLKKIEEIPLEQWKSLASFNIFFGHQSVGQNIVEGMIDLKNEYPEIDLNIVESKGILNSIDSAFFHSKVGRNTRPESKIRNFRKVLESNSDVNVDVAILKFCYVDLMEGSDPETVFEKYSGAISELHERFPETVFIHMTVPIEASPAGAKGVIRDWMKLVLGRPRLGDHNRVRERYNELLRNDYGETGTVFDIAQLESIGPGGGRRYIGKRSNPVFVMDRRYTDDGGHLNRIGRRFVAEQFLVTLAGVAGDRSAEKDAP